MTNTYRADIDYGQGGKTDLVADSLTDALYDAFRWANDGDWPTACRVHVRVWRDGETPDDGLTQEVDVEPKEKAVVPQTGADW